jgi:NAD(P)-dependent dehydrogenase (short-subunit alcohol dehydrogenase family)
MLKTLFPMSVAVRHFIQCYFCHQGQGIGEAIALRLAKDGLDVALNDIPGNLEKVKEVSEKIMSLGRKSSVHLADVSVEDQVKNMVEEVVKEHGGLDVVSIFRANSKTEILRPKF